MSNSPTYKKFLPMTGYKDIYYNSANVSSENTSENTFDINSITQPNRQKSEETTIDNMKNKTIKSVELSNFDKLSKLQTPITQNYCAYNNMRLDKRRNKSTNNLHIETDHNKLLSGIPKHLKIDIGQDSTQDLEQDYESNFFHKRQNILDRRNLNSKKSAFIFPTPKENNSRITIQKVNTIYDDISDKITKIINTNNYEKKNILVDSITRFFKETGISEEKLKEFLDSL
jgi:hypothetical protein